MYFRMKLANFTATCRARRERNSVDQMKSARRSVPYLRRPDILKWSDILAQDLPDSDKS